jgi:peptidyl-prolyl cis-trans isomerase SurA
MTINKFRLFKTSKTQKTNTRSSLGKALSTAVFSGALLSISFFGTSAQAAKLQLDRVAAQINNDIIMESEVKTRIETIKMQFIDQGRPLPPEHVLTQEILDQLITEELQLQMAQRAGIRISDQELNQSMNNIAKKNGMTLDQFKAGLESEGTSYSTARAQIKREMIISRIRQNLVNRRIKITDQEVKAFLNSKEGKEKIAPEFRVDHFTVPVAVDAVPDVLAEKRKQAMALLDFWKQTKDYKLTKEKFAQFQSGQMPWNKLQNLPSLFADRILPLGKGDFAELIKSDIGFHIVRLTDKRGGDNFVIQKTHVRHILVKPNIIRTSEEAKTMAEDLYQQLMDGADFAELARQKTDDTGSAVSGGDLGWMSGEELVPSFAKVMYRSEIDEISKPFQSQFGWHILQVLGRKDENMASQYQNAIARNYLRKKKFQDEQENWLQELRDDAYIETKL